MPSKTDYVDFNVSESGFGIAVIILGIVCLIVGCLGVTTAKVRGFCLGTFFLLASLIMGCAFLIVGIIMSGFLDKSTLENFRDRACVNYFSETGPQYLAAVDKQMCSLECPCDRGDGQEYQDLWSSYSDDYLRQFNRTVNMTPDEFNAFYFEPSSA
jgi:hypothetical protein